MKWIIKFIILILVSSGLYWGWMKWDRYQRLADLKTRTIKNLIVLPGGDFSVGNYRIGDENTGPWARDVFPDEGEHSPRLVNLKPFALSAYETLNEDFALYLSENDMPHPFVAVNTNRGHVGYSDPMSWSEAVGYCKWLGNLTGLPIRLPTEDEWEFAARYKLGRVTHATDNGTVERGRNTPVASRDNPEWNPPIGSFPPTPAGFYDMAAGSYEWVSSHENDDIRIMKGGSDYSSIEYETIPSRFVVKRLKLDQKTLEFFGYMYQRYIEMGIKAPFLGGGTVRCAVDAAPLELLKEKLPE